MKCVYCEKDFTPKRSTAKFCSDTCRVKSNRGAETEVGSPPEAPEKEKKAADAKQHCPDCTELPTFGHFCPNKECACWQSKEEQAVDIEKMQKNCLHPDIYYSRCLSCLAVVWYKRVKGKFLGKEMCEKHKGAKYMCGCKV